MHSPITIFLLSFAFVSHLHPSHQVPIGIKPFSKHTLSGLMQGQAQSIHSMMLRKFPYVARATLQCSEGFIPRLPDLTASKDRLPFVQR